MFRKDRIGRRGGGVILYVKESIQAYEIKLAMAVYTIQTSVVNFPGCVFMRSYKLHKFDCVITFNMPMP